MFELLAEAPEPLDSAAVSSRLGSSPRGTELLLDTCVSLKLLQADVRGGKGKHPGCLEEDVLKAHSQHSFLFYFSGKSHRVSLLSLVGRPRGLCR